MSAAAERAAFAAIGRDLRARGDAPGAWRAAGLIAPRADPPPTRFERLAAVPDWLRWPHARQVTLAHAVALRALAPALAASIDGGWLGQVANVAGEAMLDWAIALGADEGDRIVAPIAADALADAGFATLRAALPADLRGYVPGGDAALLPVPAGLIDEALAHVEAAA